jgi:hypothetical protein
MCTCCVRANNNNNIVDSKRGNERNVCAPEFSREQLFSYAFYSLFRALWWQSRQRDAFSWATGSENNAVFFILPCKDRNWLHKIRSYSLAFKTFCWTHYTIHVHTSVLHIDRDYCSSSRELYKKLYIWLTNTYICIENHCSICAALWSLRKSPPGKSDHIQLCDFLSFNQSSIEKGLINSQYPFSLIFKNSSNETSYHLLRAE